MINKSNKLKEIKKQSIKHSILRNFKWTLKTIKEEDKKYYMEPDAIMFLGENSDKSVHIEIEYSLNKSMYKMNIFAMFKGLCVSNYNKTLNLKTLYNECISDIDNQIKKWKNIKQIIEEVK